MFVYHGTSHEAYLEFLKTGFCNTTTTIWTCSNSKHMYFWHNPQCENDSSIEDIAQQALLTALESAQIAAAITHSHSEKLHVIKLEIPKDDIVNYPDNSTYNMDGAIAIPKNILSKQIYPYEILHFDHTFVPSLGLFYLSGCNTDLLNINLLSHLEQTVLRSLSSQNIYFDDIHDVIYDTIYERT